MKALIWNTGNSIEQDWEYQWIHSLFSSEGELEVYENISYVVEDALIVVSVNHLTQSYLEKYESLKVPFWLIILSDEFLQCSTFGLQYKMCRHIFRNYYYPNASSKITFIGLGYKTGFWKDYTGSTMDTVKERPYLWSFVGTPTQHPDRRLALSTFQNIEPNFIYFTKGFNSQNALSVEEYRDTLIKSTFVLCPMGNANLDTFRLYESLEAGAIPVVLSSSEYQPIQPSYWEKIFNNPPPFIHGRSWDECSSMVQNMNKDAIEALRMKCYSFWNEYKIQLKKTIHQVMV